MRDFLFDWLDLARVAALGLAVWCCRCPSSAGRRARARLRRASPPESCVRLYSRPGFIARSPRHIQRGTGGITMRKFVLGVAAFAISRPRAPQENRVRCSRRGSGHRRGVVQGADSPLTTEGAHTIATGNPAYEPWYAGKTTEGSEWESSCFTGDPYTCEGYESASPTRSRSRWASSRGSSGRDPVQPVFVPGPKRVRLRDAADLQSEKRAEAVDSATGYFDVNQASSRTTIPRDRLTLSTGLKDLSLGAPIGTTSLQDRGAGAANYEPRIYPDLDLALKGPGERADRRGRVDYPTAFYGYRRRVVGQFPPVAASRSSSA